jgi:hypothetical protein
MTPRSASDDPRRQKAASRSASAVTLNGKILALYYVCYYYVCYTVADAHRAFSQSIECEPILGKIPSQRLSVKKRSIRSDIAGPISVVRSCEQP